MNEIDKVRLAEIYKKYKTTKITYISDFLNMNDGIGCFIIGEPKDPKLPYLGEIK